MHLPARALLAAAFAAVAVRAADPPKPPTNVSYYRDVRPIVAQHCQGCHQPAKPQGEYVMTSYAGAVKSGKSGKVNVVPGKPDDSGLVAWIVPHEGKPPRMPRGREPLAERDVQLIKQWIAQGARDDSPATDKILFDPSHPPTYLLPPVVTTVAYSPDGKLLALSGFHEVLLHQADGSGLVGRLVGLAERIQSLAFSPDGKQLAMAGGSPGRFGEVQVWDIESKKLKMSQSTTFDTLYGVSWSPDGKTVAFGCADNTLRAVEAATGNQVLFQGAHNDWVLGTVFSTDGRYLASISRDRSVKLTEVATQRFIDNVTSITPGALKGGLAAVALRPFKDKRMVKAANIAISDTVEKVYDELLIGGSDGTPRLYKMHRESKRVIGDDANKVREYEPLPGRVFAAGFGPEGKTFAVGSSLDGKGEVRVYETETGRRVATFEGQKGAVYALAFRPDGKQVATAGFDGAVRLNDPVTGKLIKEFVAVPLTTGTASR